MGTNTGHYAFIDTFEGVNGHKARLVSEFYEPKESPSGQFCLSFFYFMYGNAKIGPLNVYVQTLNSNNINVPKRTTADGNLLWNENGNKGSMWLQRVIPLNETSEFFVVLEAQVAGFKSDIAIDDLGVWPHPCSELTSDESHPSPIWPIYADLSWSCSFEMDYCGWSNDTAATAQFNWTRNNGVRNGLMDISGPLIDHTYFSSSGHYLFAQSKGRAANDTARIISLPYTRQRNATLGVCFLFWYHMFGSSRNTLNVILENMSDNQLSTVWTRRGNQGNSWRHGQAYINATGNLRMRFEAVCSGSGDSGLNGDIAIDDVATYVGKCTHFHACDFEMPDDSCGYHNEPDAKLKWQRAQAHTLALNGLTPTSDRTTQTENGYVMYARGEPMLAERLTAVLYSANRSFMYERYEKKPLKKVCLKKKQQAIFDWKEYTFSHQGILFRKFTTVAMNRFRSILIDSEHHAIPESITSNIIELEKKFSQRSNANIDFLNVQNRTESNRIEQNRSYRSLLNTVNVHNRTK